MILSSQKYYSSGRLFSYHFHILKILRTSKNTIDQYIPLYIDASILNLHGTHIELRYIDASEYCPISTLEVVYINKIP